MDTASIFIDIIFWIWIFLSYFSLAHGDWLEHIDDKLTDQDQESVRK